MLGFIVKTTKATGNRILAWTGLRSSLSLDLYEKRPEGGFKAAITKRSELWGSNLHDEEKVSGYTFEQTLAFWGIHSEAGLQSAIRAKKIERASGILLFFLAAALYLHQMLFVTQSLYWRSLHGMAMISIMLLGISLWLTAHWRLRVFAMRRFVPFLQWLKNWGRFQE